MTGVSLKIAAATLAGGVVAVLVVPALMDWSSLRPGIERTATAALGWPVSVSGPISARLVPDPVVILERVSVGTAGFETVRLEFGIAPLLSGRIALVGVGLSGGRLGGGATLDGTIQLGEIFAAGGRLDGGFTASGTLGLGGLSIPFEAEGARPGGGPAIPVRAQLHLPSPVGGTIRLDSLVTAMRADGRLSLEIPSLARAVGTADLPDAPLTAEGRLSVTPDEAALQEITVALGESRVGGEIVAILGNNPVAIDVSLRAQTLDLDQGSPAAIKAREVAEGKASADPTPIAAAKTTAAPALRLPLPANVTVNFDIAADTIRWRGGVVRRPRLSAMLDGGVLNISTVSAQLPGRTAMDLSGMLSMEESGPSFSGKVKLESADPPRLRAWAWPGSGGGTWPSTARLDATLSGHDGRLDLSPLVLGLDDIRATGAVSLSQSITARLSVRGIEAAFDGGRGDDGTLVGALEVHGPSYADAVRLLVADYRPSRDGQMSASATLGSDSGALTLDDLRLTAGSAQIDGRVRIEPDGPVHAELNAGEVRLDPFLPPEGKTRIAMAARPRPAAAGHSGRGDESPPPPPVPRGHVEAIPLGGLPRADMTIHATALMLKSWRLDNVSTHLALTGSGSATFDGLRARTLGGTIEGSGRLMSGGLGGDLILSGLDAGALGLSAGGLSLAGGKLDGTAHLSTAGLAPAQLATTLTGEIKITIGDGLIRGFDLAEANARLERRDMAGLLSGGLVGGTTRFSTLSGTIRAEKGVISSRDLSLTAEGGRLTGTGNVDLGENSVDARVSVAPAGTGLPPLGIRLHGRLDTPDVVFDANEIMRAMSKK
ncbi:AsmA family protein [Magnetospirillum molischianum]|uniref:AsmA domain-containing protein n=1 Tax=Magnetospirillum molischianum DSM 120 TaxID=1150626 RepID=H8FRL7_MAGML|nr:AsmA-like C-terminal region-containing protein [Magnetospirillum molischianum]CCG41005.1 conserved hypothetical protein [Magnetospirillum molischianum DSM 120]